MEATGFLDITTCTRVDGFGSISFPKPLRKSDALTILRAGGEICPCCSSKHWALIHLLPCIAGEVVGLVRNGIDL